MADWVGNDTSQQLITPTVDTGGAYSAGDCIGTKQTLAITATSNRRSGTGKLVLAVLYDKANQIGTHSVVATFFKGDPTSSTFTDQAAFNVDDADLTKIAFSVEFSTAAGAQHFSSSANQWAVAQMRYPYEVTTDTLYVVFSTKGTPTFVSSSDLSLLCMFERD